MIAETLAIAATAVWIVAAIAALAVAVWLGSRSGGFGKARRAIVAALALTGAWCVALAAAPDGAPGVAVAETVRNLAWLYVAFRLFASDGRDASLAPIRPVAAVLAAVETLHLGAGLLLLQLGIEPQSTAIVYDVTVLFRLLVAIGTLVLVHNLYVGASHVSQAALRWPATGLAVLWATELNLYTIAYLSGSWPAELAITRALAVLALAAMLAIGAARRDAAPLRFRPSRSVTFHTFSLLVIGIYLVVMVAIAQWLSLAGGDLARIMELAFVTLAGALAVLVLPSARLRGWLKVVLSKHLFQHRYDYREEWLRFTRTIGKRGEETAPLGERVIQAVADIAESPAGLLLAPDDNGDFALAGRWQWPAAEVPAIALPANLSTLIERDGFIVDLDQTRAGESGRVPPGALPQWLQDEVRAWALVPLIHFERLVGVVVLARPPLARRFDWEDFDLLRVVGQQLASYLAESTLHEALAEASRFDDFHRRIAFVMHDIKNLASQLSLLARNAEVHADNPEFRADMLVTLRNSSDKLAALLARLSRYRGGAVDQLESVAAHTVTEAVVAQFRGVHPVLLAECQPCEVTANRELLEQLLVHLIQNAIDASAADAPVFVTLTLDGLVARFDVVDQGSGMSPEFVRTRLFKPFVSSKPGGFGIGAFEARELARAMRGRLEVELREGLGSRFTLRLPLSAATGLGDHSRADLQRLAS